MHSALRHTLKLATAILFAAGLPSLGHAGNVSWSVSIGTPHPPAVYVAPPPVVYVQPQPVYVQPQPVYVQPRPVYVQPQTVYVQPGPVVHVGTPIYVYEQPRRHKGRHHQHWKQRHHSHDYRY